MQRAVCRVVVPLGTSVALHAAIALLMVVLAVRPRPIPQMAIEIQVVDVPPAAKAPEPPPRPVPMKVARAPRTPQAVPPPTPEAPRNTPHPVVITGITMESTSQGSSFAVGAGNSLRGAPETPRDPQ